MLETLLAEQLDLLSVTLEKTRSSGVFLILDATVNPELDGAEYSKAGLFIKNMEPNIVSSSFSNQRYLKGVNQPRKANFSERTAAVLTKYRPRTTPMLIDRDDFLRVKNSAVRKPSPAKNRCRKRGPASIQNNVVLE